MKMRMYGLVNYQLTGIQKGIQFLHGVVEYSQMVTAMGGGVLRLYNEWANNSKTVILLNGGTTNNRLVDGVPVGSLNQWKELLDKNNILNTAFYEEDLGDQMTVVVFLVEEGVFDNSKYPLFVDWLLINYGPLLREIETSSIEQISSQIKASSKPEDQAIYTQWVESVGGAKNAFLKDFLKPMCLA